MTHQLLNNSNNGVWKGYIDGGLAMKVEERAVKFRSDVFRIILNRSDEFDILRPELAVFLDCLQSKIPSGAGGSLVELIIEHSLKYIGKLPSDRLFGGRAGVLMLLNTLEPRYVGLRAVAEASLLYHKELRALIKEDNVNATDLVGGVVGLGRYLLQLDQEWAQEFVVVVLNRLRQRCVLVDSWGDRPPLGVDLGLAHGLPGLVSFVADAVGCGLIEKTWLVQLTEVLRSCKLLVQNSHYPYVAGEAKESRLAWCYGDLSVALSLLKAGRACQDHSLVEEALSLVKATAARSMASSRITDASLCHGIAGVAHCFNWAYVLSGEPSAIEAARRWFALQFQADFNMPINHFGFLEGITGNRLALLAAIGAQPHWDAMLLLSGPPQSNRYN